MSSSAMTYSDWKAPAEDGQVLLWPLADQLLADTRENHQRLSREEKTIQNIPIAEVRKNARQSIGHTSADQPIIADGHQTELYHPGVWAKRILAQVVAGRMNASALHLAVDSDAPKHLYLRWPGVSLPITDDPELSRAHWSGLLKPPSSAHLEELNRKLAGATFAQPPAAPQFLALLAQHSHVGENLSSAITQAQQALDETLSLRVRSLLARPVWESDAFLLMAHHVIARAGDFASAYNGALAEYRREKKVRSPMRPMPDLAALDDCVELPFWLDDLQTGARIRPSAFTSDDGYVICLANGETFYFDPSADGWESARKLSAWLHQHHLRLAPRAVVLTMFMRLLVVDQFIHGIGGGQYDQITDRILAAHFKIVPPRFAVTTATMYLPEAIGRARVCITCLEQEGRRLRHNALGSKKQAFLHAIEAAPRHSSERYAAFATMQRELSASALHDPAIQRWQHRLADARAHQSEEAVVFDRELFYAMQPRHRLLEMIDHYRQLFHATSQS